MRAQGKRRSEVYERREGEREEGEEEGVGKRRAVLGWNVRRFWIAQAEQYTDDADGERRDFDALAYSRRAPTRPMAPPRAPVHPPRFLTLKALPFLSRTRRYSNTMILLRRRA